MRCDCIPICVRTGSPENQAGLTQVAKVTRVRWEWVTSYLYGGDGGGGQHYQSLSATSSTSAPSSLFESTTSATKVAEPPPSGRGCCLPSRPRPRRRWWRPPRALARANHGMRSRCWPPHGDTVLSEQDLARQSGRGQTGHVGTSSLGEIGRYLYERTELEAAVAPDPSRMQPSPAPACASESGATASAPSWFLSSSGKSRLSGLAMRNVLPDGVGEVPG